MRGTGQPNPFGVGLSSSLVSAYPGRITAAPGSSGCGRPSLGIRRIAPEPHPPAASAPRYSAARVVVASGGTAAHTPAAGRPVAHTPAAGQPDAHTPAAG